MIIARRRPEGAGTGPPGIERSALIGTVRGGRRWRSAFCFLSLYGGVLEDLETLLFGSFLGITAARS